MLRSASGKVLLRHRAGVLGSHKQPAQPRGRWLAVVSGLLPAPRRAGRGAQGRRVENLGRARMLVLDKTGSSRSGATVGARGDRATAFGRPVGLGAALISVTSSNTRRPSSLAAGAAVPDRLAAARRGVRNFPSEICVSFVDAATSGRALALLELLQQRVAERGQVGRRA
jgi:hypothetical protein